jgi:hypothetical protein
VMHHLRSNFSPYDPDTEPPAEEAEEQTTEHQVGTGPRTRAATRRGRVLPSEALVTKRRRKVSLHSFFPHSRLSCPRVVLQGPSAGR